MIEALHTAVLTAADRALSLQEEIDGIYRSLVNFSDPEGEAEQQLPELLQQRQKATDRLGLAVLRYCLAGGEISLHDPVPKGVPEETAEAVEEAAEDVPERVPEIKLQAATVAEAASTAVPPGAEVVSAPAAQDAASERGRAHPVPPVPISAGPPPSLAALERLKGHGLAPSWVLTPAPPSQPPVAIASLQDVMRQIGEPVWLTGENVHPEYELLMQLMEDLPNWVFFPSDAQRLLLSVATCRGRQIQEMSRTLSLDMVFHRLSQFSQQEKPGFVHGLARTHQPKHGNWFKDAGHSWRELKQLVEPKKQHEPEPEESDPEAVEPEVHALPLDWPWWPLTQGKFAVMIGGEPREHARQRIQEVFGFIELEWVQMDRAQNLANRVDKQTVEMVILVRSLLGHRIDDIVLPPCRRTGTPWVSVERGYGVNQIRLAIERFLASHAHSHAEQGKAG